MLKLKKDAKNHSIQLCWRERERFINPLLLKALGLALLFHLSALLLFHIKPFHSSPSFWFPPVTVYQTLNSSATTQNLPLEKGVSQPPPLPAFFPCSSCFSLDNFSLTDEPKLSLLDYSLTQIDLLSVLQEKQITLDIGEPLVQFYISGELAKRKLLTPPLFKKLYELDAVIVEDPFYVKYDVQIDEKLGSIFWYEKKQSSGNPKIDQLAEKLLLDFLFEPNEQLASVRGTLDFVIYDHLK